MRSRFRPEVASVFNEFCNIVLARETGDRLESSYNRKRSLYSRPNDFYRDHAQVFTRAVLFPRNEKKENEGRRKSGGESVE